MSNKLNEQGSHPNGLLIDEPTIDDVARRPNLEGLQVVALEATVQLAENAAAAGLPINLKNEVGELTAQFGSELGKSEQKGYQRLTVARNQMAKLKAAHGAELIKLRSALIKVKATLKNVRADSAENVKSLQGRLNEARKEMTKIKKIKTKVEKELQVASAELEKQKKKSDVLQEKSTDIKNNQVVLRSNLAEFRTRCSDYKKQFRAIKLKLDEQVEMKLRSKERLTEMEVEKARLNLESEKQKKRKSEEDHIRTLEIVAFRDQSQLHKKKVAAQLKEDSKKKREQQHSSRMDAMLENYNQRSAGNNGEFDSIRKPLQDVSSC